MSLDTDQGALSVTLHDATLHEELTMLVDLIVAVSESAAPLTLDQIDTLLFRDPTEADAERVEARRSLGQPSDPLCAGVR